MLEANSTVPIASSNASTQYFIEPKLSKSLPFLKDFLGFKGLFSFNKRKWTTGKLT